VPEPRRAPPPEGPEDVAERVRSTREGRFSPRKVFIGTVVGVEIALQVAGLFLDLASPWLLSAPLALLLFLLHRGEKKHGAPSQKGGSEL